MKKLTIALVGLGFGMQFLPIYRDHPNVQDVYVCDKNEELLEKAHMRYDIPRENCFRDYQAILDNPAVDAVHLVTPPATHAPLSIRALDAGKHCGCTIPMGMSIEELYAVIDARRRSGKNYMFLETTIYQRETLFIKEQLKKGIFGKLQYMSCAHYQDMEGWPSYWEGFPPLMHPTHAVAPCLTIADRLPVRVYGHGSGRVSEEMAKQYGCPFAFESALITLEDSDVAIEMERFLYSVARGYSECFRIYGENRSFEWQQKSDEKPVFFTRTNDFLWNGRTAIIKEEHIDIPDYAHLLPPSIGKYTFDTVYNSENSHLSFAQGGGHGGSHPHLVHEFVSSIIEQRRPYPDDIMGAHWTGVGIKAHESAMCGKVMDVPQFAKLQ